MRRNAGRGLAVVIESTDKNHLPALQDLHEATRAWLRTRGWQLSDWPTTVQQVMDGTGGTPRVKQYRDDDDQIQRFALCELDGYDLLLGVSSRRIHNAVGDRSENIATNVLLDLLGRRDPDEPLQALYGRVLAVRANRIWRNEVGGSHLQKLCEAWDIIVDTGDGRFDPLEPGSSLLALINLNQSSQAASQFIRDSSNYRRSAHEDGRVKFPRAATHPAIFINPETRVMRYDLDVVAALREAAEMLIDGDNMQNRRRPARTPHPLLRVTG